MQTPRSKSKTNNLNVEFKDTKIKTKDLQIIPKDLENKFRDLKTKKPTFFRFKPILDRSPDLYKSEAVLEISTQTATHKSHVNQSTYPIPMKEQSVTHYCIYTASAAEGSWAETVLLVLNKGNQLLLSLGDHEKQDGRLVMWCYEDGVWEREGWGGTTQSMTTREYSSHNLWPRTPKF